MALLTEGIERGNVRETGRVSKLTIDGISQNYKVYQIRLDELYFNPQNDRIRTWMSSYESNGGEVDPSPEGRPAYNDAVAEFIRQSNPAALKKTRNNIRLYGQEVPAIVLDNGLIIDGNRRFTCLRELAAEDEKFNWIDAMILPANVASDEKRIKQLELAIQFGQEGKVDYNPIDRLAGVYNDILKKRLLTPEEYAKYANMQVREVRDLVSRARLMADFLNFCNRPDDYHLARELEINGALQEMPRLMKKCADSDEAEELKTCIFANIVAGPQSDFNRFIRRFKPILESTAATDFIQQELDLAEQVSDRLEKMEKVSLDSIRDEIRGDSAFVQKFNDTFDSASEKAKANKVLSTPVENIMSAASLLENVEGSLFARFSEEDRRKAMRGLKEISACTKALLADLEDGDSVDEA